MLWNTKPEAKSTDRAWKFTKQIRIVVYVDCGFHESDFFFSFVLSKSVFLFVLGTILIKLHSHLLIFLRSYVKENVRSFSYVFYKINVTSDTDYVTYVTSYVQLKLLRQVCFWAKLFARKKHYVRVCNPKKEKNVRFRIRIGLHSLNCIPHTREVILKSI